MARANTVTVAALQRLPYRVHAMRDTMSRGLLALLAVVLGCGDDMTPADSGLDADEPDASADAGPPPLTIEWSPCTAAGATSRPSARTWRFRSTGPTLRDAPSRCS
jgi:hypothetical protein